MDAPFQNPYEPPQSDLSRTPEFASDEALRPIPFEDLEAVPGFWRRVGAMFQVLFTNPYQFYDRVPVTEGILAPWRFMLLMCAPLVLLGIGLSRIHRTDMWRGILAALLPPFLCCCGYMIFVFGMVGLAGAFGK